MKIETVIECLNSKIEADRNIINLTSSGHLVLQKIITPHKTFKVYKTYNYILWYVYKRNKKEVINIEDSLKVLSTEEDKALDKMDAYFLLKLYDFITSDNYKQLVKGEYDVLG